MAYVPHTEADQAAMLETIGLKSVEELFGNIPRHLERTPEIPPGLSEFEAERLLEDLGRENRPLSQYRRFLGGGVYEHWIPPEVTSLAGRREFMTAYTPYQSEASQGTLKAIFEFQTAIASLTGLDVSNASVYDGATALVEGALMAFRHTRRDALAVSPTLNPRHIKVLRSYLEPQRYRIHVLETANGVTSVPEQLPENTAAVVVQNPNVFGNLEPVRECSASAHAAGALLLTSVNPTSLGILAAPGDYGADIAVGEGQPLGLPPAYGGACYGFMAATKALMRKLPGRIAGEAHDKDGNKGYTLTLQAREQHIRREKATSNICTNQALHALHSTIYLSCLGPEGMRETATLCLERCTLLRERLSAIPGVEPLFGVPHFHEWAYRTERPAAEVLQGLREHGILGGIDLERWFGSGWTGQPSLAGAVLACATELTTREDIEAYGEALSEVLQ